MFEEEANQKNNYPLENIDYPKTYREFITLFPDEQSCREFLNT